MEEEIYMKVKIKMFKPLIFNFLSCYSSINFCSQDHILANEIRINIDFQAESWSMWSIFLKNASEWLVVFVCVWIYGVSGEGGVVFLQYGVLGFCV